MTPWISLRKPRHHVAIGLLAGHVDPGQHARHPDRSGERAVGVEESGEARVGTRTRSNRAELDKATTLAGLTGRSPMTDREAREPAVALPLQEGIAEIARRGGADLGTEIQPLIDLLRQLTAGFFPRSAGRMMALILPPTFQGGAGNSRPPLIGRGAPVVVGRLSGSPNTERTAR